MKLTNLQYVQSILSSLGSDEVNSVSDTTESLQVLETLRTTYFDIISRSQLPEHNQLIQLDPSLDINIPVLMYIPEGVRNIQWIKYFNNNTTVSGPNDGFQHDLNLDITPSGGSEVPAPGYSYVDIIDVTTFIEMTDALNPENDNVFSYTFTDARNSFPGTYTFYYKNNKQPQYCCILGDYYVLFDGYDSTVDSTLQASKTKAYGSITPVWSNTDSFVPNVDDQQVSLLLSETKSLAFLELKQSSHPIAERNSRRQWSAQQKRKYENERPTNFDALPNFGKKNYSGVSFFKRMGWDR